MENAEIAATFELIADILDLTDENPFKVRAYRTAARVIESRSEPLHKAVEEAADLTEIQGIGKEIAAKIAELVQTGRLGYLERIRREVPPGLFEILKLRGLGPKKTRKLWQSLGITTIEELEERARKGELAQLEGFGQKTEEKILKATADYRLLGARTLHFAAEPVVKALKKHLEGLPGVKQVEAAGSFRRQVETVGDLDILVIADQPYPVMERFTAFDQVASVESAGETRSTVILDSQLQVDIRVVPEKSFGAALCYFTGSKDHDIRLRKLAQEQGMRLSEYGLYRVEEGAPDPEADSLWVAGETEEELYAALGLSFIPPELRENRGEIEAARQGRLPALIEPGDIRGDLQMHSNWSDGRDPIETMLNACAALGYEYFAMSDHSKALAMAHGLDAARLRLQRQEMEEIAARYPEIRMLRSLEVDILADGSLDLEDEDLQELDLVVAAVHSYFDLPPARQTERIIRAISHPLVNILAHPTCRLINKRLPIQYDLEAVLQCAVEHRVAVEHNAQPDRLDLKDTQLMRARELGAMIVIDTDAHTAETLSHMRHGIAQARRAWLTRNDVLNTKPLADLMAALGKQPAV
ncbi:MAG: DNA polymerase/3'-5' exonuclease PolX [Bradymonadales bacterium]|nr:DNA polymerase/3'-5' exonuclease PolX [Bradymonadales bacterium]